jgi:formiminoglutamate deiminase
VSTAYLLERAWVDGAVHDDVLVTVADGRFVDVVPGGARGGLPGGKEHLPSDLSLGESSFPRISGESATRLPGLALPGLANTHSHAFHRALRGRTQRGRGTFWTWREQMYDLAARLTPDDYRRLARATYREMVAGGWTSVAEFHYLHHQPDGTPYADPNEMAQALLAAAREAGIRVTLLDACYLSSGFGAPPEGAQRRYSDGDAHAWAERVSGLEGEAAGDVVLGAALHSVRAVPAEQVGTVVEAAAGRPLHVHVSEQVAENRACLAAHGVTPTRLLHDHGALGRHTTAVHATHLTDEDVALLGGTGTWTAMCPTTERDLADGVGPARHLLEAGSRISLGSDSHAVVDPFEEMRALETDERLLSRERGHWSAGELLTAAAAQASIGWEDAGAIAPGARADLVVLDTASPRTAGTGADEHTVAFAATAADVVTTMVDGRVVFRADDREDLGRELDDAIGRLWT